MDLVLAYSETVLDLAAKLIVEAELNSQHAMTEYFDDIVIALSLDSGLRKEEVQLRLVESMRHYEVNSRIVRNAIGLWGTNASRKAV